MLTRNFPKKETNVLGGEDGYSSYYGEYFGKLKIAHQRVTPVSISKPRNAKVLHES